MDLIDSRLALIISYLTFSIPLSIWMMTGFFADVPEELEEWP
jgi:multiple sugar transport system permease protein